MALDIVKHHTNGIYYEVYMIKRLANSMQCNRDFEVSCLLIKNYSIAVENMDPCKLEGMYAIFDFYMLFLTHKKKQQ